ncbi:MAG: methyl-accepting chemotaxis protein [Synergistaceae bacterium]|nr:methyl-accepting chemotaxis protein [Synergistaceae bacterium]
MKNLKIGSKLLLGFGMVLLIFAVSVFMIWRYIQVAEKGSRFIVDGPLPALEMTAAFNTDFYELFLAVRAVQYREDQAAIAEYRDRVARVLNMEREVQALNRARPELRGPAHLATVVSPITRQYIDLIERTLVGIEKKRVLFQDFRKTAHDATEAVETLLSALIRQIKDSAGAKNGLNVAETNSMLDAVASCSTLMENIIFVQRDLWQAVLNEDAAGMRRIIDNVKNMRVSAEALRPSITSQEGKNAMESLVADFAEFEAELNALIATYQEVEKLHADRAPIMASLDKETSAASALSSSRVKDETNTNVENLSRAISMMFAATLVSIMLGLAISVLISRSISKPMQTIVKIATRAGDGDLTMERKDFGYEGRDEMGMLVDAISTMIENQEKTVHEIVDVVHDIEESASNLSAISEETGAAMEEVKATIDQVAMLSDSNGAALEECNSGVDEMSSGADSVAQSATESANFIAQTTDASNKAIHTVNGVIEGMRNVGRRSKESEAQTRQLVASVENVSSFVSVITGIADQTNLLALNAAIEAARAGEVGRGFAVVAEEVRKLAEESARAAQNVNGIILELQKGAQDSIKSTTEAGRVLGETLVQAEQAQKELDEALNEMNHANDSIQNIAAVAEEQAASSKEVATAIDSATKSTMEMIGTISNIRRASDDTSHAAQSVAHQAESMADNVHSLNETLSLFKLRDTTSSKTAQAKKVVPALKGKR